MRSPQKVTLFGLSCSALASGKTSLHPQLRASGSCQLLVPPEGFPILCSFNSLHTWKGGGGSRGPTSFRYGFSPAYSRRRPSLLNNPTLHGERCGPTQDLSRSWLPNPSVNSSLGELKTQAAAANHLGERRDALFLKGATWYGSPTRGALWAQVGRSPV